MGSGGREMPEGIRDEAPLKVGHASPKATAGLYRAAHSDYIKPRTVMGTVKTMGEPVFAVFAPYGAPYGVPYVWGREIANSLVLRNKAILDAP